MVYTLIPAITSLRSDTSVCPKAFLAAHASLLARREGLRRATNASNHMPIRLARIIHQVLKTAADC